MAGLRVFTTLAAALMAGFQVFDKTSDGFLVRTKTANGWAMALVKIKE